MSPAIESSHGSVPAGTYDIRSLYPQVREKWPRFNHVSEHVVLNINLLREFTNSFGDKGVESVSIEDTPFWFIDTDPTIEEHKQTYEEDFVKKFLPMEHPFPNPESLLGVVMALIEKQLNPSMEGSLARRNRFYFRRWSPQGACDFDVYAYGDKWYLDGGQACFYNRIWRKSARLFSASALK